MEDNQHLFFTGNRFLAKAIAFAGIPFSARREYDQAYLEEHKCATIKDAEKRKLGGRETWFFEQSDKLKRVIEVFDRENDAIDELVKQKLDIPFCEHEHAEDKCREFVRAMRGSKLIDRALFATVPFIRIWDSDAKPTVKNTENGKVVSYPGSKVIRADASEKMRKEMGV